MKLYDIPREIDEFEARLIAADGEITPELEADWKEFIAAGTDKVEAAAMVIRRLQAEAEICEQEADRLKARTQQYDRNVQKLKDLTMYAVKAFGGKVKSALFTIWTQRSAARLEVSVKEGTDLVELAKTHPQYVRVSRELNVSAVAAAAKDLAVTLPDCIIITPKEGTEYLKIK